MISSKEEYKQVCYNYDFFNILEKFYVDSSDFTEYRGIELRRYSIH